MAPKYIVDSNFWDQKLINNLRTWLLKGGKKKTNFIHKDCQKRVKLWGQTLIPSPLKTYFLKEVIFAGDK